jgi:hypothetical protein
VFPSASQDSNINGAVGQSEAHRTSVPGEDEAQAAVVAHLLERGWDVTTANADFTDVIARVEPSGSWSR